MEGRIIHRSSLATSRATVLFWETSCNGKCAYGIFGWSRSGRGDEVCPLCGGCHLLVSHVMSAIPVA